MAERILVVEDEPLVADMVRLNFEHAGFEVEAVANGGDALDRLRREHFDLVVLDRMLPGLDGLAVARALREEGRMVPILMLTARGATPDTVDGLDAGADDYMAKPFVMDELLARSRALIRRHLQPRGVPASHVVSVGRCTLDLDSREATTNDGVVTLTETECRLLAFFVAHPNETFGRADLLENVWGMDRFPTARTVDNYVLRLRKLFEPEPEDPRHLLTVRGRGYRFVP